LSERLFSASEFAGLTKKLERIQKAWIAEESDDATLKAVTSLLLPKTASSLHPESYLRELGLEPYLWQVESLRPPDTADRLLLLAARQSGKTTVVAGETQHTAKYYEDALNLIVCPAKDQSAELMQKVTVGISRDNELFEALTRDGVFIKEFKNLSRIIALPGTERSVRGYSAPKTIILDEAARVLDETYLAVRPMMTGTRTNLIAMTTAFGRRGWFYRAWTSSPNWRKIMVRVPYDAVNGKLVPAMPEDELRDKWKEQGITAYYSPRHEKQQLQEDLDEMGEIWWRQEYACEFLDEGGVLFTLEDIAAAMRAEEDQDEVIAVMLEEQERMLMIQKGEEIPAEAEVETLEVE
jgi:hypothetical protein